MPVLQRDECRDRATQYERHLDWAVEGVDAEQRDRAADEDRESDERDERVAQRRSANLPVLQRIRHHRAP
ncbi:hypothetical protein MELE44368_22810 [Mycolicibacterium elephantis DSM 44368]|uniref:Uncharacterized protein n=1 Tax=Mycolicibacterium elephantis DSM 44368 TaxID=1335622 RepID=A0A439DS23_9MYCO|nr:hypothetical protein MELE44368_22810 [Mycolicibacterium elephantis DSM 44368]